MAGRLEGKVAVITGASRGLGQFCAEGYAREGAKVAVAARTTEVTNPELPGTIYETAALVEKAGGEALPLFCNVAEYESCEAMVKKVLDEWGRIDILMTNAAILPPGGISTMQVKHWELEFKVNVNGPFYCIRAALPAMLEQGSGNIINVSSVAAFGGSHYGSSKRAVEAMTVGLAGELKDKGIAVNCFKPVGGIPTPGTDMGRGRARRQGPDQRPGPESYVEAAILLAEQTAETFTGQVYHDATLINLLADEETRERFRKENPERWVAAMDDTR
jgi:NAD(P)-dependent dehydrogenase (short-subunit alcohol dehydrogenase family)